MTETAVERAPIDLPAKWSGNFALGELVIGETIRKGVFIESSDPEWLERVSRQMTDWHTLHRLAALTSGGE